MRAASLVGLLLRHLPLGLSAAVGSGPAGARTATSAAGRLLPARVASASPLRAARVRASTAELAPLPDDVMLPPPAPEGRSYLPFQLEGIEFAVRRRRVIIADEMGLGKTITAIGTINALQHVKYVLVLCPKSLVLSWESELNRWLTRPFRVMQGLPRDSSPLELGGACVVVINYEMVHKYLPQLHTVRWDMLLCDEAHLLKNPKVSASRAREERGRAWARDGRARADGSCPPPHSRRVRGRSLGVRRPCAQGVPRLRCPSPSRRPRSSHLAARASRSLVRARPRLSRRPALDALRPSARAPCSAR
jgi:hypothetical protein